MLFKPRGERYSSIGATLAQVAKKSYNSADDWASARKILRDCFDEIASNNQTTEDEKTLANMGTDFGSDYMGGRDAARVRSAVVDTIAFAMPGPIGQVIARTTVNAYGFDMKWGTARKILRIGFDTILSNPQTTEDEKSLANMGIDVGNDYMGDRDAARVRIPIMKKIAALK